MNKELKNKVEYIRKFNRYYTNVLGLLDNHILQSNFSLSEARVLHEIDKNDKCTSKMLSEIMSIDAGYLSRMLKKFEDLGLLLRKKSMDDKRTQYIYLTEKGKKMMNRLNNSSDEQIAEMIKTKSGRDINSLVKDMTDIETMLTEGENININDIKIRTQINAGDMGYITYMHGWIYAEEYNYSEFFEGYVAESFYDFMHTYDFQKDHLWCAEHNGKIVGCIGIQGHDVRAQLRWFLVDPHYRKIGLGKVLLKKALDFAREKNYQSVYLDTTNDLEKAISMYTRSGFKKVSEKENNSWRKDLTELEFEMKF